MRIELKKFGDILTSREAGREALLAYTPTLNSLRKDEEIIVDFHGVSVLTPSWADEFLRPILLLKKYTDKISIINDSNPSVKAALRFTNPKLNLGEIIVFDDVIAFEETIDYKAHKTGEFTRILTFPYNDQEALHILTKNKIKKISVRPVDALSDSRLNAVIQMLNEAGIKTVIKR